MSGSTPKVWQPNQFPVRPNPQMTSSDRYKTPYFSDDRLHGRQIALGRRDHASRAHHGFCDEGGNRFRPLVIDECLEVTR